MPVSLPRDVNAYCSRWIGIPTVLLLLMTGVTRAEDCPARPARSYLPVIETHLKQLTTSGLDVYGPRKTGMWMAVIDTRTGRHPEFEHVPKRVYRKIGAPRGCSLYWDQPMLVAAYRLSELTGDPRYRTAADRYIRDFLATCVDADGMWQWGNHAYYDAFEDQVVTFSGGYHELRPHMPAWELFSQHDAAACERYLRTMTTRHVYDPTTGGFNRHDNQQRGHAFIEAGGVLVESLAWLSNRKQEDDLRERARRIARYSYRHRGDATGLVVNNPDGGRWDSKVCTTEVGLWASALLRAADYAPDEELTTMACDAVAAYLKYGYDESTGKYFGQLDVETGKPVVPKTKGYWPSKYSEVWNPDQWPTHDYPMAMAEACVTVYRKTGDATFRQAVERWAEIVRRSSLSERKTAYAGQYADCIRFLARASMALDAPRWRVDAHKLADEAVERLVENGWFQGCPDSHCYEAVDGVGDLMLALMELESLK